MASVLRLLVKSQSSTISLLEEKVERNQVKFAFCFYKVLRFNLRFVYVLKHRYSEYEAALESLRQENSKLSNEILELNKDLDGLIVHRRKDVVLTLREIKAIQAAKEAGQVSFICFNKYFVLISLSFFVFYFRMIMRLISRFDRGGTALFVTAILK